MFSKTSSIYKYNRIKSNKFANNKKQTCELKTKKSWAVNINSIRSIEVHLYHCKRYDSLVFV